MTTPTKGRRPLSAAAEEEAYLDCDERLDAIVPRLALHLRNAWQIAASTSRAADRLASAASLGQPGMVDLAFDWSVTVSAFSQLRKVGSGPILSVKARLGDKPHDPNPDPSPEAQLSELIDSALNAGLEVTLRTLPQETAVTVDLNMALRDARAILDRDAFASALHDLDTARQGLMSLVSASRAPDMAMLRDGGLLQRSFGLNKIQAGAIVREAKALIARGTPAGEVQNVLRRRIENSVNYRSEMIAHSIGKSAINAAHEAVYSQLKKRKIVSEDFRRIWVTREDARVCQRCNDFSGAQAEIDGVFVSHPLDSGSIPEEAADVGIHPLCRCYVRVISAGLVRRAWQWPRLVA